METEIVEIEKEPEMNIILGQSHFIKSVEDIYEALITSVPGINFGLAFCEASGDCLIRTDGTEERLIELAAKNAERIGAGHSFIIILEDVYPINVLNKLKNVQEVCNIFAATANPLQVIVGKTDLGRGILGVIDGSSPKGIEDDNKMEERIEFLRKIGYKK